MSQSVGLSDRKTNANVMVEKIHTRGKREVPPWNPWMTCALREGRGLTGAKDDYFRPTKLANRKSREAKASAASSGSGKKLVTTVNRLLQLLPGFPRGILMCVFVDGYLCVSMISFHFYTHCILDLSPCG